MSTLGEDLSSRIARSFKNIVNMKADKSVGKEHNLSKNKDIGNNPGESSNLIDIQVESLESDLLTNIDVSKVLKIVTKPNTIEIKPSKQLSKSVLKTYSNRRKSSHKSSVVESFALPDDPIIPLEKPVINEDNRVFNLQPTCCTDLNVSSSQDIWEKSEFASKAMQYVDDIRVKDCQNKPKIDYVAGGNEGSKIVNLFCEEGGDVSGVWEEENNSLQKHKKNHEYIINDSNKDKTYLPLTDNESRHQIEANCDTPRRSSSRRKTNINIKTRRLNDIVIQQDNTPDNTNVKESKRSSRALENLPACVGNETQHISDTNKSQKQVKNNAKHIASGGCNDAADLVLTKPSDSAAQESVVDFQRSDEQFTNTYSKQTLNREFHNYKQDYLMCSPQGVAGERIDFDPCLGNFQRRLNTDTSLSSAVSENSLLVDCTENSLSDQKCRSSRDNSKTSVLNDESPSSNDKLLNSISSAGVDPESVSTSEKCTYQTRFPEVKCNLKDTNHCESDFIIDEESLRELNLKRHDPEVKVIIPKIDREIADLKLRGMSAASNYIERNRNGILHSKPISNNPKVTLFRNSVNAADKLVVPTSFSQSKKINLQSCDIHVSEENIDVTDEEITKQSKKHSKLATSTPLKTGTGLKDDKLNCSEVTTKKIETHLHQGPANENIANLKPNSSEIKQPKELANIFETDLSGETIKQNHQKVQRNGRSLKNQDINPSKLGSIKNDCLKTKVNSLDARCKNKAKWAAEIVDVIQDTAAMKSTHIQDGQNNINEISFTGDEKIDVKKLSSINSEHVSPKKVPNSPSAKRKGITDISTSDTGCRSFFSPRKATLRSSCDPMSDVLSNLTSHKGDPACVGTRNQKDITINNDTSTQPTSDGKRGMHNCSYTTFLSEAPSILKNHFDQLNCKSSSLKQTENKKADSEAVKFVSGNKSVSSSCAIQHPTVSSICERLRSKKHISLELSEKQCSSTQDQYCPKEVTCEAKLYTDLEHSIIGSADKYNSSLQIQNESAEDNLSHENADKYVGATNSTDSQNMSITEKRSGTYVNSVSKGIITTTGESKNSKSESKNVKKLQVTSPALKNTLKASGTINEMTKTLKSSKGNDCLSNSSVKITNVEMVEKEFAINESNCSLSEKQNHKAQGKTKSITDEILNKNMQHDWVSSDQSQCDNIIKPNSVSEITAIIQEGSLSSSDSIIHQINNPTQLSRRKLRSHMQTDCVPNDNLSIQYESGDIKTCNIPLSPDLFRKNDVPKIDQTKKITSVPNCIQLKDVVRRKRGRPRKHPLADSIEAVNTNPKFSHGSSKNDVFENNYQSSLMECAVGNSNLTEIQSGCESSAEDNSDLQTPTTSPKTISRSMEGQNFVSKVCQPSTKKGLVATNSLSSTHKVINQENKNDNQELIYFVGEITWAKLGRHPYWPGLITLSPDTNSHKQERTIRYKPCLFYHVTFFGDRGRRAWIKSTHLLPFYGEDDTDQVTSGLKSKSLQAMNLLYKGINVHWKAGIEEAKFLIAKPVRQRLEYFSTNSPPFSNTLEETPSAGTLSVKDKERTPRRSRSVTRDDFIRKRKRTQSLPAYRNSVNTDKPNNQAVESPPEIKRQKKDYVSDSPKLHKHNEDMLSTTDPMRRESVNTNKNKRYTSDITSSEIRYRTRRGIEIEKELIKTKERGTAVTPPQKINKKDFGIKDGMSRRKSETIFKNETRPCEDGNNDSAKNKTKVKNVSENCISDTESKISDNSSVPSTLAAQATLYRRNNIFRGVSKQKVCQICHKLGNVVRCKGKCNGVFHIKCVENLFEKQLSIFERISISEDRTKVETETTAEQKNEKKHSSTNKDAKSNNATPTVEIVSVSTRHSSDFPSNLNSMSPNFKKLTLAEQIDYKMKEIMMANDYYRSYSESADSSLEGNCLDFSTDDENNSTNGNISLNESPKYIGTKSRKSQIRKHVTADDISFVTLNTESSTAKKTIQNISEENIDTPHANEHKIVNTNDYKCEFCTADTEPNCFSCRKAISKKGSTIRQICSLHKCGKYYHPECLKMWPQTQWSIISTTKHRDSNKTLDTFVCPLHVCHTCASDDPRAANSRCPSDKLVKCLRCPASYHCATCCVPAGTTILSSNQIVCPRHYGEDIEGNVKKRMHVINTLWCFICSEGGDLICCETCPTSVHANCLPVNLTEDNTFICEDCESGRFPLYDEIAWVKLGTYRWWPAIILFPNEIPENVRNLKHSQGEFVVKFFGTLDHYWVGRGRVFLFQEGDQGHCHSIKRKIDTAFARAVEEAASAHELKKQFKLSKEAEKNNTLKPPPYIKIKVNRPVGNVRQVDFNVSNTTPCDCNPNQPYPCGPDSDCLNRLLLTECNPQVCPAGKRCNNQCFEKKEYPPMLPYKTEGRGWGLRNLAPIRKGQFVIEYVGEIIDEQEYQRRIKKMHEQKEENYYFLTIDKDRMLDAGPKGNAARFMNHSCQPNCDTQKWTVNGDTRVGLFANQDIPADSELTFNYNLECVGKERKVCRCGAPNCSGFIGVKAKTIEEPHTKSKKSLPKMKKKICDVPSEETKSPCFMCGKYRKVSPCNNKICSKFYHLKCVGLSAWPEGGKWVCPWHNCNICSKRTIRCCVKCINSYCPSHSESNIRHDHLLGFICTVHDPTKINDVEVSRISIHSSNVVTDESTVTSTTYDELDVISSASKPKKTKRLTNEKYFVRNLITTSTPTKRHVDSEDDNKASSSESGLMCTKRVKRKRDK